MRSKVVNIEIDKLTNSIVNARSGLVFCTEFHSVSKKEIKKQDWTFNWNIELNDKNSEVYKITIKENITIIQGLVSFSYEDQYVFINLVENAKFNKGRDKLFEGVGGNLFAFACLQSFERGFGGFVGFNAKTALIPYYQQKLGAELAFGQRMFINNTAALKLIKQYFKK